MKGEIERLTRENQALHRRIQDLNSNQETNLLVRKHVIDSKHETESRKVKLNTIFNQEIVKNKYQILSKILI
jgi:hypothetical protein